MALLLQLSAPAKTGGEGRIMVTVGAVTIAFFCPVELKEEGKTEAGAEAGAEDDAEKEAEEEEEEEEEEEGRGWRLGRDSSRRS